MLLLLLAACPTLEPEPEPEPATCETLAADFAAETDAIRACTDDVDCGQELTGTSCGCTNNWVARTDADTTAFYALIDAQIAAECDFGLDSDCSCPAADGFACDDGVCTWNYTDTTPPALPACRTSEGQPYTLDGASITGDTLSTTVTVGGGCDDHAFTLCWPDGSFMESDPVQVRLELLHESDDPCDAIVSYAPTFDLAPLKGAWQAAYGAGSGTITVHLDSETLTYSF